jgi:hypothetical protein
MHPQIDPTRKGVKNHFSWPRVPMWSLTPYEAVYAAAQPENGKAWGARGVETQWQAARWRRPVRHGGPVPVYAGGPGGPRRSP